MGVCKASNFLAAHRYLKVLVYVESEGLLDAGLCRTWCLCVTEWLLCLNWTGMSATRQSDDLESCEV